MNNFIIRFMTFTTMLFFSVLPLYLMLVFHKPGFLFLYAPIFALYIAGIIELTERNQKDTNAEGG